MVEVIVFARNVSGNEREIGAMEVTNWMGSATKAQERSQDVLKPGEIALTTETERLEELRKEGIET